MITDEQAEKAIDYIRDNSEKAAEAKANRIYMEEYRKSLKAIIMSQHAYDGQPVNAQEKYAYADQRYKDHLLTMKEAIKQDEQYRWMMVAAQAKLEAWKVLSWANRKASV